LNDKRKLSARLKPFLLQQAQSHPETKKWIFEKNSRRKIGKLCKKYFATLWPSFLSDAPVQYWLIHFPLLTR